MKGGIVGAELGDAGVIPAPVSGVQLGRGEAGPLALRLFRLAGTRVTFASALAAAQLVALRVAAAGTPVQVITTRAQFWEPLLPPGAPHAVSSGELGQPAGGPSLVIDDRPAHARAANDVLPWQCRMDVRTDWLPGDLAGFGYTDLAVFGGIPGELTAAVASAFALPAPATEPLARLDPGTAAVLRRGRIEYVALDPTPAERQVLDAARGAARPAAPIWR